MLETIRELDHILADKGFRNALKLHRKKASLITPPVKIAKIDFNADDIRNTEIIANLRIHVERAMRRVKEFRCLSVGALNIQQCDLAGDMFYVCAMLSNFQKPLTTVDDEPKADE